MESDGQLKSFHWANYSWEVVSKYIQLSDCGFPLACGKCGVCSNSGPNCQCPDEINISDPEKYFMPLDAKEEEIGCKEN